MMRVIIVGNGVAGNAAAESIMSAVPETDVIIVSEDPFPEYSACVLCDYISGELARERVFLKSLNDYSGLGIKAILGKGIEGIDQVEKHVQTADSDCAYDKLILATGSEPIIPPIKGIGKSGVFCLKSLRDADVISAHNGRAAAIIGAGPIGIEAAVALTKRGYKVWLIELLDSILPNLLERNCSALLSNILRRNGVKILVGERVTEIQGNSQVESVVVGKTEISCDTVILALGMKPRTELARKSGIDLGPKGGVKVNSRMKTNIPDIYACGDCVESVVPGFQETISSMLWYNAKQQGKVAGLNAVGVDRGYSAPMSVVSLRVFDSCVAAINSPEYSPGQEYERLERRFGDRQSALIMNEGRLISVQTVGAFGDMGVFLPFVQKNTAIQQLRNYIDWRQGVCRPLWANTISYFL